MTRRGLLERLAEGGVLGDGGYLMGLRLRGFVEAGSMTPEGVVHHPEEGRIITREFKEAGAEVLQTLTFFGTTNMLAPAGLGDRAEEINRTACRIAREAAGEDALVAGNLNSPSIINGDYDPANQARRERTRAWLDEQLPWIVDEGADFLILETFSWLDEALVALEVAKDAGLELVVTVSMEREGRATLDGVAPGDCARRLVDAGADVVGINCLQRPAEMLRCAVEMREAARAPVCCQPSAWHSWWADSTPVAPEAFGEFARAGMAAGIGYLGSCCGAGPEHVRAMASAMGK